VARAGCPRARSSISSILAAQRAASNNSAKDRCHAQSLPYNDGTDGKRISLIIAVELGSWVLLPTLADCTGQRGTITGVAFDGPGLFSTW